MLRWIIAGVGVFVLSITISAVHMHLSSGPSRRPHDAAALELDQQISRQYEPVPLIRLLAVPERYDGHRVRVSGFVTLGFEDLGLHLDESAYKAGLRQNAIWLERPDWLNEATARRLNRRYGEVAGTFDASHHGYGVYSGTLTNVQRISPAFTQLDFEKLRLRENRLVLVQTLLSGWFLTLAGWMGLAGIWLLTRRRS